MPIDYNSCTIGKPVYFPFWLPYFYTKQVYNIILFHERHFHFSNVAFLLLARYEYF